MRWVPRSNGGRLWLAIGASLIVHAALIVAVIQVFQHSRQSPSSPESPVDRRIGAPVKYPSISFSFDDPPAPAASVPKKVQATPFVAPDPGLAKVTPPQHDASTHANAAANHASAGAGNAMGAIAPLHGKIAKASFSVVYVLDRSGSMGRDRKLTYAVAMLKASLHQLGADARFQIVAYDSRAATLRIAGSPELVLATEANRHDAEQQIEALTSEGSSRHLEGLRVGLGLRPDLLILLTDADELSSRDVQQVRKWNTKGSTIHAVLIGSSACGHASLKELAGPDRVHFVALPAFMP